MPRIRTIKPEFWKSEAIATHSFRARLTFIGLWTYVDDNGVGIDNPKLIQAELFPLEEDPREALANVREDLARLHAAGRIVRYTVGGKAYLSIVNWREHQKIDKPGKARHPEPDHDEAVHLSSENAVADSGAAPSTTDVRESVARPSRLEQGTGNREEGSGNREVPPAAGADAPSRARQPSLGGMPEPELTETQRSKLITDAYAEKEPMCKWVAVNGVVLKAVRSNKFTDDEIRDAMLRLAAEGRSVTVDTLRVELTGLAPRDSQGRRSGSLKHEPFKNPADPAVYHGEL